MIKIKTYPITNNLILTNEILGRNSSRVAKFEVLKRSCFITIFITNNKLYYKRALPDSKRSRVVGVAREEAL
jgi:hypothetical protein